jgi:hypothetical protein
MICAPHQILFSQIKKNYMEWACGMYGRWDEVHTGFWLGDLTGKEHLGDVDRRIILKCIFFKRDVKTWTGLLWLKVGRGGGCL